MKGVVVAVWGLAVDVGTTCTAAATVDAEGRVDLLAFDRSWVMPSVVCLDEEGRLLVGRAAAMRGAIFPEQAERLPKRALMTADQVRLGGRTFLTLQLIAAILAEVAAEASRQRGGEPGWVVVTHPARWGERELDLLVKAAREAGLPVPGLMPEPVAAASYYLNEHQVELGRSVAVFDFGGGTLDIAVLRRTANGFALAGRPGGDPGFGGEDLDAVLRTVIEGHARQMQPDAWERIWTDPGRSGDRVRARWLEAIRTAKEDLSKTDAVTVYEDGFEEGVRVTRREYETAIDPRLRAGVRELAATISAAGLAPEDVAAVYLTGGASRTPAVSDLITMTTGVLPVTTDDPKTAVVRGALITPPPVRPASRPSRAVGEHHADRREPTQADAPSASGPASDARSRARSGWVGEPVYRQRGEGDPERIGDFTLLGVLGSGGMGTVYLGFARGRYVAVKQVLRALSGSLRFEREVQNLYRLPDGVGPKARANDCTAERPWFATDYVPGCTVTDVVTRYGPLPREALWRLLHLAAGHLRAVHGVGIAHRDLTPNNVMLTADGLQLIDFGIARAADQVNVTGVGGSGGTRGFMAPEQSDGGEVGTAADVYALGALVCYAATGDWPGRVPALAPLREIDAGLADAVEPCLAAGPDDRCAAADLAAATRDRVPPADEPWPPPVMERIAVLRAFAATPPKLSAPPRRRRSVPAVLVAVVALAAAATAVLLLLPDRAPSHAQGIDPAASRGPVRAAPTAAPPPPPTSARPTGPTTPPMPSPAPGSQSASTASSRQGASRQPATGTPADTHAPNGPAPTTSSPPPAAPPPAPPPGPPASYALENAGLGQCLTFSQGVEAGLAACTDRSAANGWNLADQPNGTFELVNKSNGQCIQEQTSYGGAGLAASCAGTPSQQWTVGSTTSSGRTLVNAESKMCLVGNYGSGVDVASCDGQPSPQDLLWSDAGTI